MKCQVYVCDRCGRRFDKQQCSMEMAFGDSEAVYSIADYDFCEDCMLEVHRVVEEFITPVEGQCI